MLIRLPAVSTSGQSSSVGIKSRAAIAGTIVVGSTIRSETSAIASTIGTAKSRSISATKTMSVNNNRDRFDNRNWMRHCYRVRLLHWYSDWLDDWDGVRNRDRNFHWNVNGIRYRLLDGIRYRFLNRDGIRLRNTNRIRTINRNRDWVGYRHRYISCHWYRVRLRNRYGNLTSNGDCFGNSTTDSNASGSKSETGTTKSESIAVTVRTSVTVSRTI
jgi:hypothetical protein